MQMIASQVSGQEWAECTVIVTDVCIPHKVPPVHTVDEILASSPLSGLRRVSGGGGCRQVALVRLAERFADLDGSPPGSLVVLSRAASAEVTDYRLDMALRWAAVNQVAAVAAFSAEQWQPTVTAMDIAGRADIALISIPAAAELARLVQAIAREIGGGADRALGRAEEGLNAVLSAEAAGPVSTNCAPRWAARSARSSSSAPVVRMRGVPMPAVRRAASPARSRRRSSWATQRSATWSRRMLTGTSASPRGWSCTPPRPRPGGFSTWPGAPARSRPGPAANCWPNC